MYKIFRVVTGPIKTSADKLSFKNWNYYNRVFHHSKYYIDYCDNLRSYSSSSLRKTKNENERLINLANMKKFLETNSQTLLTTSIPEKYLHEHVILRLLPNTHPYFPCIKGKYAFFGISKTLKLIISNFMLNRNVRFHLNSVHVEEPSSNVEVSEIFEDKNLLNELENKLIEEVPLFDYTNPISPLSVHDNKVNISQGESISNGLNSRPSHFLFPWTYKIIIRWKTCSSDCYHLKCSPTEPIINNYPVYNKETDAEKKSENKNQDFDLMNINESIRELFGKVLYSKQSKKNSSKSLNNNRVISGLFVFELNLNNDKILVLTIDDVEIIDKKAEEEENFNNLVTA